MAVEDPRRADERTPSTAPAADRSPHVRRLDRVHLELARVTSDLVHTGYIPWRRLPGLTVKLVRARFAARVGSGPALTLRSLVRSTRATVRGRDLAIVAAGLTFYSGIAVVPIALLVVWSATLLSSPGTVLVASAQLQLLVPAATGARPVVDRLVDAGVSLPLLGAVVALFPASFYGEGVRRACLRLVPRRDRFTGWRARLALAPLSITVVITAAVLLAFSDPLADLARLGGAAATLAHIAITFHLVWVIGGMALTWTFRAVAPGYPSWSAAVTGGFATSAVLAGFLHGFLLFLALPLDLGAPFGGLQVIGGVVAVGLWLLVLHLLFLLGWTATTALDRQWRGGRNDAALEAGT